MTCIFSIRQKNIPISAQVVRERKGEGEQTKKEGRDAWIRHSPWPKPIHDSKGENTVGLNTYCGDGEEPLFPYGFDRVQKDNNHPRLRKEQIQDAIERKGVEQGGMVRSWTMGWMVFERISIPSRKRKLNKGQRKEGGNKGQGVSGRRSEKKEFVFFFLLGLHLDT